LSSRQSVSLNGATATETGSLRDAIWILGFKAELYALENRDAEALALYRQAVLQAEAARAPKMLFRWQWYAGRLLAKAGQRETAITPIGVPSATSRLSGRTFRLRPQTGDSCSAKPGPFFLEHADLLLQRAGSAGDDAQTDLVEARNTIERLRTVELEDYFGDD
jgi:hypothetical protein